LILHQYRRCFDRIFVFSPSVDIDMTWLPVKKYVSDTLTVDVSKEPCFFEHWDPADLEKIIDDQYRIIEFQKKQKHKKLLSILVVIDDHADNAQLVHNNNGILAKLYFRGRHLGISTLVSTQKLKAISSAIRANLQFLFVWRLRNYSELESLLEELSAQGRLDPNVVGTDVPFAEEIAAAVVLEGWSHARSQAGRWVNRLMRLVSDGIPVHSTHTIVAHLALAWSAHHDGRTNESLRAACVARFAAELPSAAGVGAASFVRAANLFHPVSCPKGHAR
jgi:hypothetical protein